MLPTVEDAVRDNAAWCDTFCRSHGLAGTFAPRAWTSHRRTPLRFPDAVTLTADASRADILGLIDTSTPGCSVKDSYSTLDLGADGFGVLFDAEWIGSPSPPATRGSWIAVTDPRALDAWEAAWAAPDPACGHFLPALLDQPEITVLADVRGGTVVAGAITSRGAEVVGFSNFFDRSGDADAAWVACNGWIGHHAPGLPVVGYEAGVALDVAIRHGFRALGPLRVWLAQPFGPSKR